MNRSKDTFSSSIRFPRWMHQAMLDATAPIGQSLNQFVVQAVAQRLRRWKAPDTHKGLEEMRWPSGWPKDHPEPCPACGKSMASHDPATHGEAYKAPWALWA